MTHTPTLAEIILERAVFSYELKRVNGLQRLFRAGPEAVAARLKRGLLTDTDYDWVSSRLGRRPTQDEIDQAFKDALELARGDRSPGEGP